MKIRIIHSTFLSLCYFLGSATFLNGQDTIADGSQKAKISFSGVADVYYAYDFNQPITNFRQPFLYNHNRHNEFNLNIGLLRASVEHAKYRANLGIQAGTYAQDNYAAEEDLLQHVFEANAGIALQENLWLDAGIFGSHIGFESAITSENWTLTRSLLAENSPYFLSGAKLSYTPNEHWELTALLVNGWQRIQRVPGNSQLSLGTQIQYKKDNFLLNWSTFTGTDDPDIIRRMRYFNNLYGQFELTDRWGLIAGIDVGAQQTTTESDNYHFWFSPVLITRYQLSEKWASALRAEYYGDEHGVIVPSLNLQPFKTSGFSANIDYAPSPNAMWRLEGRWFRSPNDIFYHEGGFKQNNFFLTSSITVLIGD